MPLNLKSKASKARSHQSKGVSNGTDYPDFPLLTPKVDLELTVLEQDQILTIADLLSPGECKAFVAFIEKLPLEATPPKKKGEADRVNHRLSIRSPQFAGHLFGILEPHLPSFPIPASATRKPNISVDPHSLNSNIRLYRYSEGDHFGRHYDDSVKDPETGAQSEWTLLIYLTGEAQGVVGGQTVFYRERRGEQTEEIVASLARGTALVHRHGHECMLHEGKPIVKGVKYVLRSDVMFKR
ncbi:hypothetical protein JB92DRAFT_2744718 [Gautieria morchelliformis]|nr:hypothetical protein JB92DRAFT_2744718 [Gautieria morchelliformis]